MSSRHIRGALVYRETLVHTAAGNVTLVNESVLIVNKTSGEATTVTLPASPLKGRTVIVKDGKGDSNTNAITVQAASGNIDGAASVVIRSNYACAVFTYNGTEWNLVDMAGQVAGMLAYTGIISPTALSGAVNDYNPTGLGTALLLRIAPNGAARNITGLAGGSSGRALLIVNISAVATENLLLKHQDAASAAGNRIIGANQADVTVRAGGACLLVYDGTASRWVAIAI